MHVRYLLRFLLCILIAVTLCSAADAKTRKKKSKTPQIVTPPTLVERAQAIRAQLMASRDSTAELRVKKALRAGTLAETDSSLAILQSENPAAAVLVRFQLYMQQYRFSEARAMLPELDKVLPSPETEWQKYRWHFLREDLPRVDSLTRAALIADSNRVDAILARGELSLRLLKYDYARSDFFRVMTRFPGTEWRIRAQLSMGRLLYREDRYQESLDTLLALVDSVSLTDDVIANTGLALISLARVNEAIEMLEEAARWNPNHELAQYYLGNGYARLNYTQLRTKNKENFPPESEAPLRSARDLWTSGNVAGALRDCRTLIENCPQCIEPRSLLGSIYWSQGRFDSAALFFHDALAVLPDYGRARNGLAKSLEGLRMLQNVNRAADSTAFAKLTMPEIPRIAEFIVNWNSLSPRHQKQVALSVAPWKVYLPVLIESGSRYYIKPLHELLSESPGLETIRDQRIEYDSRLWDDVRGCGGFTTVTGVEDVERSIFFNYNTVLHELTHQVHGVFPPADVDRINNTFNAAAVREDGGLRTFMSRYQQASVWEYFAEGANAYYSPRRNGYDTREIVRERLMERDTLLARLVEYYVQGPNLDSCYPIGLINAAENELESQKTEQALVYINKAYARAPRSETVLSELSRVHSILDHDSLALAWADSSLALYPRRAASSQDKASARFFTDGSRAANIELLTQALAQVDTIEQRRVRQTLGVALWYEGRYVEAAAQFRAILHEVKDDPDAQWGLAVALGDGGNTRSSDSIFQKVIAQRSGVVELRLDYARILLQAGRLDEAALQLEEAQLLARGDPELLALKGWYTAQRKSWKEALRLLDRAVELAPDQRLAHVLRLDVRRHYSPPKRRDTIKRDPVKIEAKKIQEMERTDIPVWTFLERKAQYVEARTWPHFQRALLQQIVDEL
ncbi:hypothetical protein EHM69_02510 [candidate division KSB1 bacterium]|nr:MAG: hypothetical protein EHM69_02510 [candidate division KSB1 bacterium]